MTNSLGDFIPSPVVAVIAYYPNDSIMHRPLAHVCGVRVIAGEQLSVQLYGQHQLEVDNLVTLHLDNRTGVADYDADLKVYRLSYKGQVTQCEDGNVVISPLEFQIFYGIRVVHEYRAPGYTYPKDDRASWPLEPSPLISLPNPDEEERENKIGVLVTCAQQQPHTTVLAFLSSDEDDIFFITMPSTFKGKLLSRDNYCLFAIDNRDTFTFEHAIQWNFSIISGFAYMIPNDTPLFHATREAFIEKVPWEIGFFSNPEIQIYHIVPERVFTPE